MTETDDVIFSVEDAIGIITLNRPRALNALNRTMCLKIDSALKDWVDDDSVAAVIVRGVGDRAFCAGGDVRAVYDDGIAWKQGRSEGAILRGMFHDEYRMNRRIKNFPKPYIALIDGITMGGGAGLAIHGSHIVATERTVFAMPETGIGLFPDIGASFVLPRLAGEIGTYLALTGARIKSPDLIALGIATHSVPSACIADVAGDLIAYVGVRNGRESVDQVLTRYQGDGELPALPLHRETMDRCFAHDRVEDILAALDRDGSVFAAESAATIRALSPTSLKITLSEMRRGRTLDFDGCIRMEFRLSQSVLAGHDFYEGIRALLIDKDRRPKWHPASLHMIDDTVIDHYFQAPRQGDIVFID